MKKGLKNQNGMSRLGLIIIVCILILFFYFLLKSVLFNDKDTMKIENQVAGYINQELEEVDLNTVVIDESDDGMVQNTSVDEDGNLYLEFSGDDINNNDDVTINVNGNMTIKSVELKPMQ